MTKQEVEKVMNYNRIKGYGMIINRMWFPNEYVPHLDENCLFMFKGNTVICSISISEINEIA